MPLTLKKILGTQNLIAGDSDRARPYTEELRGRFPSECAAIALPSDTTQVAAVVAHCAREKIGIVPQGGNTGAVGGAVAHAKQVILNLARMNRVLAVDTVGDTMHVQAGCILAAVQDAARAHDKFFPLSLGAQGSCQIGGNLATNAGGVNVLHYGNARDLVLGLEVVLADGRVWNGLNALRKNNTGYDLKNLFIGAEGTLGIITGAVLKLYPAPQTRVVLIAGVNTPDAALALLARLRTAAGNRVVTFELMANIAVHSAVKHIAAQTDPLRESHDWYVLAIADSVSADDGLRTRVENCLAHALTDGEVQDAVIAANESQADALTALRANIVEAQKFIGGSIKHDIAVPVAAVPELLRRAQTAILTVLPTARVYPYGHIGDGNIHLNVSQPPEMSREDFFSYEDQLHATVHEIADELGGTFSAEHGVGLARLGEMKRYKDPVTLELYRRIKGALDGDGVFNVGKVNP